MAQTALCIEEHKFYEVLYKQNSLLLTCFHKLYKIASLTLQENVLLFNTSCCRWCWCIVVHLRLLLSLMVLDFEFSGGGQNFIMYVVGYIYQWVDAYSYMSFTIYRSPIKVKLKALSYWLEAWFHLGRCYFQPWQGVCNLSSWHFSPSKWHKYTRSIKIAKSIVS